MNYSVRLNLRGRSAASDTSSSTRSAIDLSQAAGRPATWRSVRRNRGGGILLGRSVCYGFALIYVILSVCRRVLYEHFLPAARLRVGLLALSASDVSLACRSLSPSPPLALSFSISILVSFRRRRSPLQDPFDRSAVYNGAERQKFRRELITVICAGDYL